MQMLVQTDDGKSTRVQVGPAWYLERQDLDVKENTRVQVTGARAEIEGQPVLMAREVQFDGQVITLRDRRACRCGAASAALQQIIEEGENMLGWAVTFLVIALIAAVFGFAGIAGAAAGIAQILFYIFLVIFLISLVMGLMRGRTRV